MTDVLPLRSLMGSNRSARDETQGRFANRPYFQAQRANGSIEKDPLHLTRQLAVNVPDFDSSLYKTFVSIASDSISRVLGNYRV